MRRLLTVFAVALTLAGAVPPAGGGRVTAQDGPSGALIGRVEFRRPPAAPMRRPDVSALGSPAAGDLHHVPHAVVHLEAVPGAAVDRGSLQRARIDQRNEMFHPRVLSVTAGTEVDFPNSDSTYHNVFSLSRTRRFDLGRYPQGSSRSVVFNQPGVVRVFCDIHSHMSAFVLVFSHPYHTVTAADGRYRIAGIPPGTYAVSVWHEGETRDTRQVTIAPEGGAVEVDFVVP